MVDRVSFDDNVRAVCEDLQSPSDIMVIHGEKALKHEPSANPQLSPNWKGLMGAE